MLALGAAEDDLAIARRQLRDPSVMFHTPIFTTAWGRRPLSFGRTERDCP
jgi:hypothetical protein